MKFLLCSCSHGHLADQEALEKLLEFKECYEPDKVIMLGDFLDISSFMGHGTGSDTRGDEIMPDLISGLEFLKRLEPDVVFAGNHEERLWRLKDSRNEIIRYCAESVIGHIETFVASMGAEFVPYGGMSDPESYRRLGPLAVGHGWSFGMNAEREHCAMTGGPTAIGHVHRIQAQPAYSFGGPMGYSVGCLCDIKKMGYAKNRKATAGWQNGWAYGTFSEDDYELHFKRLSKAGSITIKQA